MTNRGPEILDFRDSWLREIAAYQEHVKAHQLYAHVNENIVKNPIGSHFRSVKPKDVSAPPIKSNKVALERESVHDKPTQYIVNTYHAQLLKKDIKSGSASPTYKEPKQAVQPTQVNQKSSPVKQKKSLRVTRTKSKNKTGNKSASSSFHSKPLKSPRKLSKLKNEKDLKTKDKPSKFDKDHTKQRDANFQPTDIQADEILAAVAPQIFATPYHTKLIAPRKEPPAPINAAAMSVTSKLTIPEAHTILETIHRTLNGVKTDPPIEVQLEKFQEASIHGNPKQSHLSEPRKDSTPDSTKKTSAAMPNYLDDSNGNIDKESSLDKLDNDDSLLENDLLDIIDDQSSSSTDTEAEYSGHLYPSDEEEDEAPSTAASSNTKESSVKSNNESEKYYTPPAVLMPSLFPHIPPYVTFSSHAERGPPIPTELQRVLKWKMTTVTPKVVRYVVANTGVRLLKKTHDWMGTWDKHMKSRSFKEILPYQKYNHIPGSFKIGRKDSVWKNLKLKLHQFGKKEFGFMRRTYLLPEDMQQLKRSWFRYAQQKTKWIVKPPASARGVGVRLICKWSEIPQGEGTTLIQKYIERPLLINGNKFDLRLYVLITSVDPLRIFLHTDGLARFASVQYSDKMETIHDRCMHLTNYSINKFSQHYVKNQEINSCSGHKWTLKALWSYLESQNINTKRIWGKIRNLVVRTVIVGEDGIGKIMRHTLTSRYCCYELFGFDVLLDENLTPWLLEVNISPSLHIELPLDQHVKGPLVQNVLNMACFQVPPKLTKQQQKDILTQFNLSSPLCYDRRLYVTLLSNEEATKHQRFTDKSMTSREDYLDAILEHLTPDDVRCLVIAEDELARSASMERIFPRTNSHTFLQYLEAPRYYNRLLDAWETRYASKREEGIRYLRKLCTRGVHLRVTQSALFTPDFTFESDDDDKFFD